MNSRLVQATGRDGTRVSVVTRRFVDPAGRGVGRLLLHGAAGSAVKHDLQPVLDVFDDTQDAIAVYERAGWRLVGTGTAPWSTPDGATSTVRYDVKP